MENFGYYIFAIIAICVLFVVLKRIASCLIKSIILIVIIAAIGIVYMKYFKKDNAKQENIQQNNTEVQV